MRIRFWNSFNILGVILFAIGIAGAILGKRMIFDPGRANSGYEWLLYLIAGALMFVNGFLPASNPADPPKDKKQRIP